MSRVLYIIEQVNCRGDKWEEKTKVNLDEVIVLFKDLIKETPINSIYEKVEELEDEGKLDRGVIMLLFKLSDCWYTCIDEEGYKEQLENNLLLLEKGEGSLEFEESIVGFGLTPKDAILNLVEINEEDW